MLFLLNERQARITYTVLMLTLFPSAAQAIDCPSGFARYDEISCINVSSAVYGNDSYDTHKLRIVSVDGQWCQVPYDVFDLKDTIMVDTTSAGPDHQFKRNIVPKFRLSPVESDGPAVTSGAPVRLPETSFSEKQVADFVKNIHIPKYLEAPKFSEESSHCEHGYHFFGGLLCEKDGSQEKAVIDAKTGTLLKVLEQPDARSPVSKLYVEGPDGKKRFIALTELARVSAGKIKTKLGSEGAKTITVQGPNGSLLSFPQVQRTCPPGYSKTEGHAKVCFSPDGKRRFAWVNLEPDVDGNGGIEVIDEGPERLLVLRRDRLGSSRKVWVDKDLFSDMLPTPGTALAGGNAGKTAQTTHE